MLARRAARALSYRSGAPDHIVATLGAAAQHLNEWRCALVQAHAVALGVGIVDIVLLPMGQRFFLFRSGGKAAIGRPPESVLSIVQA